MSFYTKENGILKQLKNAFDGKNGKSPEIILETSQSDSEELVLAKEGDKENLHLSLSLPPVRGTEDDRTSYMGDKHETIRETMDANVDYILGEINTVHYDGTNIAATDTVEGRCKNSILKGRTLVNSNKEGNDRNEYVCMPSVEGQNVTVNDTVEGLVKSAILKGNTLVNIFPKLQNDNYLVDGANSVIIDENIYKVHHSTSANHSIRLKKDVFATKMKPNTDYTLFINIIESTITKTEAKLGISTHGNLSCIDGTNLIGTARVDLGNTVGFFKEKVRLKDDLPSTRASDIYFCFWDGTGNDTEYVKFKVMLVEGDYTNVEIPYFEGMSSVKAPVLTTANYKNLANDSFIDYGYISSNEINVQKKWLVSDFIPIESNKSYTTRGKGIANGGVFAIAFYDKDKTYISKKVSSISVSPSNALFARINVRKNDSSDITEDEKNDVILYFEKTEDVLPFELHKSSTLTTPQDLVLRKVGDVEDTLDLVTGELIQRIGEVVLDGSDDEGWVKHSTTNTFSSAENTVLNSLTRVLCICDKMIAKQVPSNTWLSFGEVGVFNTKVGIGFNGALEELIIYLQQNPITVQYELETPIVTKIDLQGQKAYSYDDTTHYNTSSEELAPVLSIDVPTNLSALIARNNSKIQEQNRRISELKSKVSSQTELLSLSKEINTEMLNTLLLLSAQTLDEKKEVK